MPKSPFGTTSNQSGPIREHQLEIRFKSASKEAKTTAVGPELQRLPSAARRAHERRLVLGLHLRSDDGIGNNRVRIACRSSGARDGQASRTVANASRVDASICDTL
jgi:hypothetical protein